MSALPTSTSSDSRIRALQPSKTTTSQPVPPAGWFAQLVERRHERARRRRLLRAVRAFTG